MDSLCTIYIIPGIFFLCCVIVDCEVMTVHFCIGHDTHDEQLCDDNRYALVQDAFIYTSKSKCDFRGGVCPRKLSEVNPQQYIDLVASCNGRQRCGSLYLNYTTLPECSGRQGHFINLVYNCSYANTRILSSEISVTSRATEPSTGSEDTKPDPTTVLRYNTGFYSGLAVAVVVAVVVIVVAVIITLRRSNRKSSLTSTASSHDSHRIVVDERAGDQTVLARLYNDGDGDYSTVSSINLDQAIVGSNYPFYHVCDGAREPYKVNLGPGPRGSRPGYYNQGNNTRTAVECDSTKYGRSQGAECSFVQILKKEGGDLEIHDNPNYEAAPASRGSTSPQNRRPTSEDMEIFDNEQYASCSPPAAAEYPFDRNHPMDRGDLEIKDNPNYETVP